MRGRIDVSEGGRPAPPFIPSSNLIQQFDYGLGLSRILQIKERAPAPTLGSELVPVIVADELRKSAYPPRPWCIASRFLAASGVNRGWIGVNCRGQVPSGNVNDRLVVHLISVENNTGGQMAIEIGRGSGVIGLSGGFAQRMDSTRDQPAVGVLRSDFTGTLVGESADAPDANAQQFLVVAGGVFRLHGPFIIGQGEAVFVRQETAGVAAFSATFLCEEYAGP